MIVLLQDNKQLANNHAQLHIIRSKLNVCSSYKLNHKDNIFIQSSPAIGSIQDVASSQLNNQINHKQQCTSLCYSNSYSIQCSYCGNCNSSFIFSLGTSMYVTLSHQLDQRNVQCYKSHVPLHTVHYNALVQSAL